MKRSEVVKELALELKDIVMENYIDQKGEEWCANLILTRLEELGMRPSGYCLVMATGKLFNQETDFGRDTIYKTGWEPEK